MKLKCSIILNDINLKLYISFIHCPSLKYILWNQFSFLCDFCCRINLFHSGFLLLFWISILIFFALKCFFSAENVAFWNCHTADVVKVSLWNVTKKMGFFSNQVKSYLRVDVGQGYFFKNERGSSIVRGDMFYYSSNKALFASWIKRFSWSLLFDFKALIILLFLPWGTE